MTHSLNNSTSERLLGFIKEIEEATERRSVINEHISDIFAVAVAEGYDRRAMREVIKRRKMDPNERNEFVSMLEIYEREAGL